MEHRDRVWVPRDAEDLDLCESHDAGFGEVAGSHKTRVARAADAAHSYFMETQTIRSDTPTSRAATGPSSPATLRDETVRPKDSAQGPVLSPRRGEVLAYERVSTADQRVDRQTDALDAHGYDRIFTDQGVSGTKPARERPGMADLLAYARDNSGDVLLVVAIDRLGRSAADVLGLISELKHRGIALHVLNLGRIEGPLGELLAGILASVSQLERDQLAERTRQGIAAARLRGASIGRPPSFSSAQRELVWELHCAGRPVGQIAEMIGGVSRRTVQRTLVDRRLADA